MLRSLFLAASIAPAGSAEAIVLTEPPDFADDPMNPTSFILDSGTNSSKVGHRMVGEATR